MKYFLGVDGGQSSTTALIGDETGRVIGYGRGGPCNHVQASEGRAKFINAMEGCLVVALNEAGLHRNEVRFRTACLGFSGGPADKEAILHEILPADNIIVTHDGLIALSGATAGTPGIIAIAGTGQLCFGRNAQGKTARAGGWGYIFGDEGGGFDLTRQALRAALRMEEGWGAATSLHQLLLNETGASDADDLVHRFYTTEFPRPAIAALSKLVHQAAEHGDTVAMDILFQSAKHQALFVAAVRNQLFTESDKIVVATIGGVWNSHFLRERFRSLVELEDGNQVITPRYSPATGALIEAFRAAGLSFELTDVPESEK